MSAFTVIDTPYLPLGFSNTRTPSPPWIHVVRLVVPMSCCNDAASHLVKAFGGADVARRVVGGVKWWQVRGLKGLSSWVLSSENSPFTLNRVDAQWITTKKDWQEAKRRHKMQQAKKDNPGGDASAESGADSGVYNKEMDRMRCILYAHGGTSCFLIQYTRSDVIKAVITLGVSIKSGNQLLFSYRCKP
jgi:hypothetical protein